MATQMLSHGLNEIPERNLRPVAIVGEDSHKNRTFIEFFAGIGLTHLGLASHGWHCVYANDIEPKKKKMYETCFGPSGYYHVEDVWKTSEIIARIPCRVDLATASFPCVDLSLAGNLKGFSGAESGAFYGFIKVLKRLKQDNRLPKAVLVENVVGFLSSHKGENFRTALQELAALGYRFDAFIVDAKHFTPQSRPRLFVVCFLDETIPDGLKEKNREALEEAWSLQEQRMSTLRPVRLLNALMEQSSRWLPLRLPTLPAEFRNLRLVIDSDVGQEWWDTARVKKHLAEMHKYHRKRIEQLKASKEVSVGTIYRRVRKGSSKSEIRTDGLAGCLRTPRGGSSKQIVFVVGRGKLRMRWMTPREYARLQGCPAYPIEVERNEALFGFGDGVCVPVIKWIAENVLSQLFPTAVAEINQATQAACD